ncbi:MAG TPA: ComEC/Rec2 family competence protein [Patescibacteria group bacterium]|nr:ComEC/Rec2 family competence protein [Patescibacteria group bacterium]
MNQFSVKVFLAIIFLLLIFRLGLFYLSPLKLQDNQTVHFSATLLEDPKTVGNSQSFTLRFGNFWQSIPVKIVTNSDSVYVYGQTMRVIGTVRAKSLNNKQAYFTIQNPQIEAKNSGFLPLFGILRGKIITFCENNFSQPYSGLLVGIIFGIKSQLTNGITRSFRITGIAHIVAASGMNVTLVTGFLFTLLGSLLTRRLAVGASIFGIFLYVVVSGFDASIVRAALMGSVAFSAMLFGRQYSSVYILFLVGTAMLLWDPILLTDVGFQLSFLATAGILFVQPLFSHLSFFSDDLATTLSAQVATLPVLLSAFGQYSLLSIIANVLVLWTIPIITIIGGVGIVLGLIFEPLGKILILFILPLLWYVVTIASFFAQHAVSVQISSLPMAFVVGYYLLLISMALWKKLP